MIQRLREQAIVFYDQGMEKLQQNVHSSLNGSSVEKYTDVKGDLFCISEHYIWGVFWNVPENGSCRKGVTAYEAYISLGNV